FLPGSATRDPDPELALAMFLFHDRGNKPLAQGFEGAVVAEEAGDIDQQVVKELLHFVRVITEKSCVLAKPLDPMQRHPTRNSALQSRLFICGKIDSRVPLKRKKNATQIVQVPRFSFEWCHPLDRRLPNVGMPGDSL